MAFDNVTLVELNVSGDQLRRSDESERDAADEQSSGGGPSIGKVLVGVVAVVAVALVVRRVVRSRRDDDGETEGAEYPPADVEVERPRT